MVALGATGCATAGMVVVAGPAARAATAPCSASGLVAAVAAANTTAGGGTVTLPGGCTYTLTAADNSTDGPTGLPRITGDVTVQGNGDTITRSSGAPAFRLFDVAMGGHLTLNSVRVTGGDATGGSGSVGGGGVYNAGTLDVSGSTFANDDSPGSGSNGGGIENSGSLTVVDSVFSGNTSVEGGGLLNEGTATVDTSTFTGNTATAFGGGGIVGALGTINLSRDTFTGNAADSGGGGAIDNDSTVSVDNSTFTGNSGGTNGGGAVQNFGSVTFSYTTLSGDSAPSGAELHNFQTANTPGQVSMSVADSIVANGNGGGSNCGGNVSIADGGYNIDSGTSCRFANSDHSKNSTNPQLGALANNGGPTETMALAATSPAVNAIPTTNPTCGGTDQRGVTRPQGTGCDIGAYELKASALPPPPPSGAGGAAITGYAGRCVDDYGSGTVNGNKIDIYRCNGTPAQAWTFTAGGELVNAASGKCLNDAGYGGQATKQILWTCNGASNERWTHNGDGEYVLAAGGGTLCLNDPGFSTADGTQLIVWPCGQDAANERWSLPA